MTDRSLNPPRVWFWFVPAPDGSATNIRKWSHAPFPESVEYRPAKSALLDALQIIANPDWTWATVEEMRKVASDALKDTAP